MDITWLGQGSFLFESGGYRLAIDPYLTDVLAERGVPRLFPAPVAPEDLKADSIVCTHDHADHFDPGSVLPAVAAKADTAVAGPCSVVKHGAELGLAVECMAARQPARAFGPFAIQAVPAHHSDPEALGLLISVEGKQIYVTGDSLYDESLAENALAHGPVDLLLICVNGKLGNMTADEAVKVACAIKPRVAIPMHYGLFACNTVDPEAFLAPAREAGCRVAELQVGAAVALKDLL